MQTSPGPISPERGSRALCARTPRVWRRGRKRLARRLGPSTGLGDLLERRGLRDDDPAFFEADEAAPVPVAKASVHALARATDHAGERALGKAEFHFLLACRRGASGAQQRF